MQSSEARELIWRCASHRDSETWRVFRKRYEGWLAAGVRRALLRFDARVTEDEREDLLQDVYCRLLEKDGRSLARCRAEVEGAVVIYLVKVAESVVVDYLRSRGAAKRGRNVLMDLSDESGPRLADRVVDPGVSPEDRLLWNERRVRFLSKCLTQVGKRTARRDLEVFYMAMFEGWTSREICSRMDGCMTPSAVDSLVHRLKRRLGRLGIEIPRR